jgi:REP element-mobilizing transposase RayT
LRRRTKPGFFIDVLRTNTLAGKFKLHDFVVMPDHFHVLLTVDGNTSIERAVQILPLRGTFPQAPPHRAVLDMMSPWRKP